MPIHNKWTFRVEPGYGNFDLSICLLLSLEKFSLSENLNPIKLMDPHLCYSSGDFSGL